MVRGFSGDSFPVSIPCERLLERSGCRAGATVRQWPCSKGILQHLKSAHRLGGSSSSRKNTAKVFTENGFFLAFWMASGVFLAREGARLSQRFMTLETPRLLGRSPVIDRAAYRLGAKRMRIECVAISLRAAAARRDGSRSAELGIESFRWGPPPISAPLQSTRSYRDAIMKEGRPGTYAALPSVTNLLTQFRDVSAMLSFAVQPG
jgi:hypothetical protein